MANLRKTIFFVTLLLVLILPSDQNSTCQQESHEETRIENYFSRRRFEFSTINTTTTCSNVSAIESLDSLPEKNFDQFLKIVNSTLTTIPSLALSKFFVIKKLFLGDNHVEKIIPGAFTGLVKLTELHLDNNKLSEVSNGVYNSLQQLKVLNLTNNRIKRIEKFALMGVATLRQLHLRNNSLLRLEDRVFETLKELKLVDLAENPLTKISITGLTTLDSLSLANTSLTNLDASFTNLTIRDLDMTSSQIRSVDFATTPITQKMNLSNNKIVSMINCDLLNSSIVSFANNRITIINGTFSALLKLDLSHNAMNNLTTFGFNNTKALQVLDFSHNEISTIAKNLFRGLDTLLALYLQNNEVTQIDTLLFRDLTTLRLLNLSSNKIEHFQYGTFDTLKNLKVLDISNNRLKDLHQYTFSSLSNLEELHFDNNQISSLHETHLRESLPRLRIVFLDENSWECQELVFMVTNLKKNRVTVVPGSSFDVENFQGIPCENNKVFRGGASDSFDEMSGSLQKILDDAVENSKMVRFFNEDFEKSGFMSFLRDHEVSLEDRLGWDEKYMEKFTSDEEAGREVNNEVVVSGVVIQVFILILLLIVVLLISKYLYFKDRKVDQEIKRFSDIEMY